MNASKLWLTLLIRYLQILIFINFWRMWLTWFIRGTCWPRTLLIMHIWVWLGFWSCLLLRIRPFWIEGIGRNCSITFWMSDFLVLRMAYFWISRFIGILGWGRLRLICDCRCCRRSLSMRNRFFLTLFMSCLVVWSGGILLGKVGIVIIIQLQRFLVKVLLKIQNQG